MSKTNKTTTSVQSLADTFFTLISEDKTKIDVEFNKVGKYQIKLEDGTHYSAQRVIGFDAVLTVPVDLSNNRHHCSQCYAEGIYKEVLRVLEEGNNFKQEAA